MNVDAYMLEKIGIKEKKVYSGGLTKSRNNPMMTRIALKIPKNKLNPPS